MTLSKERLTELANFRPSGANDVQSADREEWKAMARELMGRRERDKQEPVAYMVGGYTLLHVHDPKVDEYLNRATPLYAAPTAPDENYQQLSDLYHEQEKRLFKIAQRIQGPSFDKYAYSPSQAIDVLEAAIFGESKGDCRAAALNQTHVKQPASNEPVSQPCKLVGEVVAWDHPTKERSVDFRWLNYDVAPGTQLYAILRESE